jgi:hypothetical protein
MLQHVHHAHHPPAAPASTLPAATPPPSASAPSLTPITLSTTALPTLPPVSHLHCSIVGCLRHFKTCETLRKHIHSTHPNLPASATASLHSSSSHQPHSAAALAPPTAALSFSPPVLQRQNSLDLASLMASLDAIVLPPTAQPPTTQQQTPPSPPAAACMTYKQRLHQVELALQPPSADQLAAERQAALLGHRMASLH